VARLETGIYTNIGDTGDWIGNGRNSADKEDTAGY